MVEQADKHGLSTLGVLCLGCIYALNLPLFACTYDSRMDGAFYVSPVTPERIEIVNHNNPKTQVKVACLLIFVCIGTIYIMLQ